uniref:Uncharacterized protein n=1 Tax=Anguilla anguilla TaxID=7936 RepID=A0A0E9TGM0_ANGAN
MVLSGRCETTKKDKIFQWDEVLFHLCCSEINIFTNVNIVKSIVGFASIFDVCCNTYW